jgi:RecA/RadA recombinase
MYSRPDTVTEVFNRVWTKGPKNSPLHIWGVDSLAALSTKLEMETADKMGMRRAKEFSEGLRKSCRMIANNPWIMACTNQVRQSETGEVVPGGNAFPYYSTIRLRVSPVKEWQVVKKVSFHNKEHSKITGIKSKVVVKKSSYDEPFRECTIFIIFNYGIHDIMTNLQFLKDTLGLSMYPAVDKEYHILEQAVRYIEKQGLELQVREEVKQVWNELQDKFHIDRKPKVRF